MTQRDICSVPLFQRVGQSGTSGTCPTNSLIEGGTLRFFVIVLRAVEAVLKVLLDVGEYKVDQVGVRSLTGHARLSRVALAAVLHTGIIPQTLRIVYLFFPEGSHYMSSSRRRRSAPSPLAPYVLRGVVRAYVA